MKRFSVHFTAQTPLQIVFLNNLKTDFSLMSSCAASTERLLEITFDTYNKDYGLDRFKRGGIESLPSIVYT
jgi:hypothetical protein